MSVGMSAFVIRAIVYKNATILLKEISQNASDYFRR